MGGGGDRELGVVEGAETVGRMYCIREESFFEVIDIEKNIIHNFQATEFPTPSNPTEKCQYVQSFLVYNAFSNIFPALIFITVLQARPLVASLFMKHDAIYQVTLPEVAGSITAFQMAGNHCSTTIIEEEDIGARI